MKFTRAGALLYTVMAFIPLLSHAQDPTGVIAKRTRTDTFEFGRFGTVHTYIPDVKIRSAAIFAAGDGGWNDGINDMAQLLANEGTLVIGIDTPHYLTELNTSNEACAYPAGELESLAHAAEKKYALATYLVPTLVGYSSGATLAYVAAAQAPKGTFRAALTLGFCKELTTTKDLCRGRSLNARRMKESLILEPAADLALPWTTLQGGADQACTLEQAQIFVQKVSSAKVIALPKVGHGYAVARNWQPQYLSAYRQLSTPPPVAQLAADVRDLPLVEMSSNSRSDTLAVLLTGDGGWAGLDREVASGLANAGIPVAALSSLQYFWQLRTPEQAAKDITRIIDHYTVSWRRERVLLVGYSFGADVLPAIINQLPERVRTRVSRVALIGLSAKASFEIHVGGWLGRSGDTPVMPQLERAADYQLDIRCIRGEEESDSICSQIPQPLVTDIVLKGGHHFNGNYSTVVHAILDSKRK